MNKVFALIILSLLVVGCGNRSQDSASMEGISRQSRKFVKTGMKLLEKGDVSKAIWNLDEAIRQDPRNSANYVILGQVYLKLKNFEKAQDSFQAATRVDPADGKAFYLLAVSKHLRGRLSEAAVDAQKSAEIFIKKRDKERFQKSVNLLNHIKETTEKIKVTEDNSQNI